MSYIKIFFPILFTSIFILSCKKKNQNPEEYFIFYANGVKYEYPQEKGHSLAVGAWKTLGAGPTFSSLGYILRARNRQNPTAEGAFYFYFPGNEIPSQDTIILDGVSNKVRIENFLNFRDNYELHPPLTGKIIFSERTNGRLSGTFEFEAELYRTISISNREWTDSILHITQGRFSIIPSSSI